MTRPMSKVFVTAAAVIALIIIALACAENTEAAPKYAKSVADIQKGQYFILEAADYPKAGYVAAPDANGWMTLVKYSASTAESKHAIWMINNIEQGWKTDMFGGEYLAQVTAPTYTITNHAAYDPSSTASTTRYITYTKSGFYWMPERFVSNPLYEHGSDPNQRWTIKKVDTKDGKAVFRFYGASSKISFASGGWGRFFVRFP